MHKRHALTRACACRGALGGQEAVEAEGVLAGRILGHLVRQQGALVVVAEPERREGEGNAEFARRRLAERMLAVNPNLDFELA